MKKALLLSLLLLLANVSVAHALTLDEAWEKYSPPAAQTGPVLPPKPQHFPGRVLGTVTPERMRPFQQQWEYRKKAYEMHHDAPLALASGVYGLALYVKDIDASLPREKFIHGVLGYHYRVAQVCAWANDAQATGKTLTVEEMAMLGLLLADNVITTREARFAPTGVVDHIVAAAPGRKRSFEQNLRHERLHILWDEDAAFKQRMHAAWSALSAQQKNDIRETLHQYAKDNEEQLIEEWAIKEAEKQDLLR